MPWSLERKLPIILIVVSLMLGAIGFLSFQSTRSLRSAVEWQKRTDDVLLKLDQLLIAVIDAETSARGYVITGREGFVEPFASGRDRARQSLTDLRQVTADNLNHDASLDRLDIVVREKLDGSAAAIETRRVDGLLGAVNQVSQGTGDLRMNEIRQIVDRMRDEELRLLKIREANLQQTLSANFYLIVVSSFFGLAALVLANFVVLFEIRKRRSAEAELVSANAGLEERVATRTTELAEANLQLKESELFRRSVVDSLAAQVAVIDAEGQILLVNDNWEGLQVVAPDYTGNDGKDVGENYLAACAAYDDDVRRAIVAGVRATLNGEQDSFRIEYPVRQNERERWFLLQVNSLSLADGGAVVSHYDITDRIEAESNQRVARREAEIANRLRDEFMATVSHELRTPLNAILGWAKILESGRLDQEKQSRAVETIIRNAETQNRLINDLLEVARIISGKLELSLHDVTLSELVRGSVEAIRPAASEKSINVELNLPTQSPPPIVRGDTDRLRQIFANLLTNAVKFTPDGGVIEVDVECEGRDVLVHVTDNGAGISPDFLPFVFERFRQDAATIQKSGGLGLGLAIVRQLTELHGGEVSVSSEGIGKGARFTVRLPRYLEMTEDLAKETADVSLPQ